MSRDAEKAEILERLDASREALGRDLSRFGESLDVPRRFRRSIRRHPLAWIGGSVAGGIFAAMLFRPGRKGPGSRTGLFREAGPFLAQMAQLSLPSVVQLVTGEVDRWSRRREVPEAVSGGQVEADD